MTKATPLLEGEAKDTALVERQDAPLALSAEVMEKLIIDGDLSGFDNGQRVDYYNFMCARTGVDPATRPFAYIKLNNKLVLYALRSCTDQLRVIHGVSVIDMQQDLVGNALCRVTAKIQNAKGRVDTDVGAVSIAGLKGDALANALMKAATKAKRRATLSICGLGMLDESELDTIPALATNGVEAPADTPAESGPKKALRDFLAGQKPKHLPPPETNGDAAKKAEAKRVFMETIQTLSDRDCNGWKISELEAAELYRSAAKLSGLKTAKEMAEWLPQHARLIAEDDGSGAIREVRLEKTE